MNAIKPKAHRFAHPKTSVLTRVLLLALSSTLLLFTWNGWRVQQYNRALLEQDLAMAKEYAPHQHLLLVEAFEHEQIGAMQLASEGYAALRSADRSAVWATARFNIAGVYLQQAAALELEQKQDGRAVLIELAKQHYRALLRDDASDTAVAQNLAIALALQPDVVAVASPDLDEMPERSPQAPVTVAGRERLP